MTKVTIHDSVSSSFRGTSGVKQGWSMSPILSNIDQNDLYDTCGPIIPSSMSYHFVDHHAIGTNNVLDEQSLIFIKCSQWNDCVPCSFVLFFDQHSVLCWQSDNVVQCLTRAANDMYVLSSRVSMAFCCHQTFIFASPVSYNKTGTRLLDMFTVFREKVSNIIVSK